MEQELEAKYSDLQRSIKDLRSVVVAFSGGVDSTLLTKIAADVLGPGNVLAATATSASFPGHEMEAATELAERLGVRHVVFDTDELSDESFASNPPERCYFCKKELLAKVAEIARREGMQAVAEASNRDDESDFRPGLRAVEEAGVQSPLREARLSKADVRALSKRLGLPTHDKPSSACLASRFPYGERITQDKLRRVERAEGLLRAMGLRQFRVRSHKGVARIELGPREDMKALIEPDTRSRLTAEFKKLGFHYVTLDLEGYRSGSMNEVLRPREGTKRCTPKR